MMYNFEQIDCYFDMKGFIKYKLERKNYSEIMHISLLRSFSLHFSLKRDIFTYASFRP